MWIDVGLQRFRTAIVLFSLAFVCLLFMAACDVVKENKYVGEWQEVGHPDGMLMRIEKSGDTYIIDVVYGISAPSKAAEKLSAIYRDGQLRASGPFEGDVAIAYIESSDHLLVAGKEYERTANGTMAVRVHPHR
jgi:hypothetical protein